MLFSASTMMNILQYHGNLLKIDAYNLLIAEYKVTTSLSLGIQNLKLRHFYNLFILKKKSHHTNVFLSQTQTKDTLLLKLDYECGDYVPNR